MPSKRREISQEEAQRYLNAIIQERINNEECVTSTLSCCSCFIPSLAFLLGAVGIVTCVSDKDGWFLFPLMIWTFACASFVFGRLTGRLGFQKFFVAVNALYILVEAIFLAYRLLADVFKWDMGNHHSRGYSSGFKSAPVAQNIFVLILTQLFIGLFALLSVRMEKNKRSAVQDV